MLRRCGQGRWAPDLDELQAVESRVQGGQFVSERMSDVENCARLIRRAQGLHHFVCSPENAGDQLSDGLVAICDAAVVGG
jgi:hypothetical protein